MPESAPTPTHEPRPVQVSPLQVYLMRQMVPLPSTPSAPSSTPPHAWRSAGHLRGEGAPEPQHVCVSVGSRQQWLRTQRVVFAHPESEGSLGMRLDRMCASVGVQRAEEFDERAHILEPRGRMHDRAASRRCSLAGLSPRTRRGTREARVASGCASPPTPPGVPRCEGATCAQRRAESVVIRFVQADVMRRTQHA